MELISIKYITMSAKLNLSNHFLNPEIKIPQQASCSQIFNKIFQEGYSFNQFESYLKSKAISESKMHHPQFKDTIQYNLRKDIWGIALTGNNSTGLNLVPTGDLFMSSATTKTYANKGVLASFWTTTTVQSSTYTYPLLFEVSTATFDSNDKPVGLRGVISNTTAYGDGITTFPAEKRTIRFVKDN
jgi:hypothetical protein